MILELFLQRLWNNIILVQWKKLTDSLCLCRVQYFDNILKAKKCPIDLLKLGHYVLLFSHIQDMLSYCLSKKCATLNSGWREKRVFI